MPSPVSVKYDGLANVGGTSLVVTLPGSVDITRSMIILSSNNRAFYNRVICSVEFTSLSGNNSSEITLRRRNSTGTAQVNYQVIEFTSASGITVQHGYVTTGGGNITISSVNLSESFALVHAIAGETAVNDSWLTADLTSSTNLLIENDSNASYDDFSWQVVSIPGANVQKINFALSTDTIDDETITSVDTSKTFVIGNCKSNASSSTIIIDGIPTYELLNSTTVRQARGGGAQTVGGVVYVVESDFCAVQKLTGSMSLSNVTTSVTISAVTESETTIHLGGAYNSSAGNLNSTNSQEGEWCIRNELSNATTVNLIRRDITTAVNYVLMVVEWVEAATSNPVFSIAGLSTANFDAKAIVSSTASIAGLANTNFVSSVALSANYSIAGIATSSFNSKTAQASTFAIAGASTSSFIGKSQQASSFAIAGQATSSFNGNVIQQGSFAIAGEATSSFLSKVNTSSNFAIAGTSLANFISKLNFISSFGIIGQANATFIGESQAQSSFNITGQASTDFKPVENKVVLESSTNNKSTSLVTSLDLDAPAGLQVGDILVGFVFGQDETGVITGPAEWTRLYSRVTDQNAQACFVKQAELSDIGATFTFNASAAGVMLGTMHRFSGASFPVQDSANVPHDGANPVCPSVSGSANGYLLCAANQRVVDTPTEPTGMTLLHDDSSLGRTVAVAGLSLTSSGATGTKTWTLGTGDNSYDAIAASVTLEPDVTAKSEFNIAGIANSNFNSKQTISSSFAIAAAATSSFIASTGAISSFNLNGQAATNFQSKANKIGAFAIAGQATSNFNSILGLVSAFNFVGTSTAAFQSRINRFGAFNIAGQAASNFVGGSFFKASTAIAGASSVNFISTQGGAVFNINGLASVSFDALALARQSYSLSGQALTTFISQAIKTANFNIAGISSTNLFAKAQTKGIFNIEGIGNADFIANTGKSVFNIAGQSTMNYRPLGDDSIDLMEYVSLELITLGK